MDTAPQPGLKVEQWVEVFQETPIFFQIYYLQDSYYIWVGSGQPKLDTLNVSFSTKFDKVPSVSTVVGHSTDEVGKGMASRLGQRTGKMIYLAYGADPSVPHLVNWAEKKVLAKIL